MLFTLPYSICTLTSGDLEGPLPRLGGCGGAACALRALGGCTVIPNLQGCEERPPCLAGTGHQVVLLDRVSAGLLEQQSRQEEHWCEA